jgi:hypothetical protein
MKFFILSHKSFFAHCTVHKTCFRWSLKDSELLFGKIYVYFEAQLLCSMCLYAVEPPSRRDVLWMHNHPFHTVLYILSPLLLQYIFQVSVSCNTIACDLVSFQLLFKYLMMMIVMTLLVVIMMMIVIIVMLFVMASVIVIMTSRKWFPLYV